MALAQVIQAEPTEADRIRELVEKRLWPGFQGEKERLDKIDRWARWDHDKPHAPRQATTEYQELGARAQAPWLGLVVTSVTQQLYVEGYRGAKDTEDAAAWAWWQANMMDGRQIAIHHAALAYGLAYTTVVPGTDELGEAVPVIRGHSPRRMMAFYDDVANDDWPQYAINVEPVTSATGAQGYRLRVYDESSVHTLVADAMGSGLVYKGAASHGVGFCPVVRYADELDLEGRSAGQVEPFIALAGRIDQTTFDRLAVQRFSSWVVRTIAGMAQPEGGPEEAAAEKLRLMIQDILVSTDKDTKFGSLPATPLEGFIAAGDADIRTLAAVSQTPSHELLGQLSNLSAEALAAARASLTSKVTQRQHTFGESHEQTLRLAALVMGDRDGARNHEAQVRWADMEPRSLAQTADALGKLAQMLGVPVEMLWAMIPTWTEQDVEHAKKLKAEEPPPVPPPAAPGGTPPAPPPAT